MKENNSFCIVLKNWMLHAILLLFTNHLHGQDKQKNPDDKNTGFAIGIVPALSYDSDLGLRVGGLAELFDYGNGERFPFYDHYLLLRITRSTKGSNINQMLFDSEKLIKRVRIIGEASYLTEQALNFYGFNGYNSFFNPDVIDDRPDNEAYVSRLFYNHSRDLLRIRLDIQPWLTHDRSLRLLAGLKYISIKTGGLDLDLLNRNQHESKHLPDVANLFDRYVNWGIIPEDQKNGGNSWVLNTGIIYDTRNEECYCTDGIWAELVLKTAPAIASNYSWSKIIFSWRQYIDLIAPSLTFAYRLSLQNKVYGEIPFYLLPFYYDSRLTEDGPGGGQNLRGVSRNRMVADGFAIANLEVRRIVYSAYLFKQKADVAVSAFLDAGWITQPYEFDISGVTDSYGFSREEHLNQLQYQNSGIHMGAGPGLYLILNKNTVISVNYGLPLKNQDGNGGLYVGSGFLF